MLRGAGPSGVSALHGRPGPQFFCVTIEAVKAPFIPCETGTEALANVIDAYTSDEYCVEVECGSIVVRNIRVPERPRIVEFHFGPDGRIILIEAEDEAGNTVCV